MRRLLDRRIKARHRADTLEVSAAAVGLLKLFKGHIALQCVDFNRYGMAVECSHKFKKGERLAFRFRGRYIHENDIEGIITSVASTDNGFRYGVVFSYAISQKSYSREVDNALSRIEALFSRHNNLSQDRGLS